MLAGFGGTPCLFTSVPSTMIAGVLAALLAAESPVPPAPEERHAAVFALGLRTFIPGCPQRELEIKDREQAVGRVCSLPRCPFQLDTFY